MTKKFISKNTRSDEWGIVSTALRNKYSSENSYTHLLDLDDSYVYFDVYDYRESTSMVSRSTYTYSGTSATISDELEEVVRTTEYKVVEGSGEVTEKSLLSVLTKFFGESKNPSLPVTKQFEDEKKEAIEVLYIKSTEVDLVGDGYATPRDVYTLVDNINKKIGDDTLQSKLFHKVEVDKSQSFEFLKAWVTECDCMIGDTLVGEGTPLVKVKFHNDKMWEARKSGDLMGLSIGAYVDEVIEVEDE